MDCNESDVKLLFTKYGLRKLAVVKKQYIKDIIKKKKNKVLQNVKRNAEGKIGSQLVQ